MLLLSLLACASDDVVLIEADPSLDGLAGADGPDGAVARDLYVQARVTERLPVQVVRPIEGEGPFPTVVFVQGGFVAPERYDWLAAHLATRGYAVVLPTYDLGLAITEPDDGLIALQALSEGHAMPGVVDERAVAMGHSLGGVVAAIEWRRHDEIAGLAMLASFPAGDGPIDDRPGTPVLSIAGSADGSADPADVRAGSERFRDPRLFAQIDGMTHYAWTDDAKPGELEKDGDPGRPIDELRRDAQRVIDAWLDFTLRDGPDDWTFPDTVEVEP